MEAIDFAKSAPTPVAIQRAAKEFLEGISQKVLTDSLRSMEADGIITRTVYAEVPPRVEYELSELGESLKPILDTMKAWGECYRASKL